MNDLRFSEVNDGVQGRESFVRVEDLSGVRSFVEEEPRKDSSFSFGKILRKDKSSCSEKSKKMLRCWRFRRVERDSRFGPGSDREELCE